MCLRLISSGRTLLLINSYITAQTSKFLFKLKDFGLGCRLSTHFSNPNASIMRLILAVWVFALVLGFVLQLAS